MNKKNKLILVLALLLALGYMGYKYVMTGGGRDIQNEKTAFTLSAHDVFIEFSKDIDKANSKYLNKTIEIYGKVSNTEGSIIILDDKVSCQLETTEKVEIGNPIKIKGRVTGYDDSILEELKLDQCIIIK